MRLLTCAREATKDDNDNADILRFMLDIQNLTTKAEVCSLECIIQSLERGGLRLKLILSTTRETVSDS